MNDILGWTAVETAKNIAAKTVGVKEIVTAHLERADAVNDRLIALPEILHESAIKQAEALDNSKEPAGPLHGLPVTIKINVDQKDTVNSNGLPVLAKNIASEDSPLVANMRRDGAVFIGRTNTPEFSLRWFTSNPLHGVTMNPWNEAITPGGSSGGASSSVAAGVGVIAHGNDLGGSLRYPAYCCGVASIRPSLGRVAAFNPSAKGVRPPMTQQMSVQGPIARSVADLRLGLKSMSGFDSRDPLWNSAQSSGRVRDGGKLRIGYKLNAFDHQDHGEVEKAVSIAVDGLKSAGHDVVECKVPEIQKVAETWGMLLDTETDILNGPDMQQFGSPEVNGVFEGYKKFYGTTDLDGFLKAMLERLRLQAVWSRFFDDYDLLLMPVSGDLPFENDLDIRRPEKIPEMLKAQKYLYVINALGLPSVAVPTHIAMRDSARCPTGVQLVGPMHDDWFCLDVAEQLEQEIGRPIMGLSF